MPRRRSGSLVAALVLAVAGCDAAPPVAPRSGTAADYGVVPFKDDAPANVPLPRSDFPLSFVDCRGETVDLTRYRNKSKVVLVVLRGMPKSLGGAFCPSCLAQVSSLTVNRGEFIRRGVEVLTVYPGSTDRLGEFLETVKRQTPGEPDVTLRVLLDRDGRACDRLGIRDDLAKPSTYVLDTKGNVVYAYVGQTTTDRPSVKAVLAQLDRAE